MALYTKENDELKRVAIGKVQHDTSLAGDGTRESELSVNTSTVKEGEGIKITENVETNEVTIGLDKDDIEANKKYVMTTAGWESIEPKKAFSQVKVKDVTISAAAAESMVELTEGNNITLTGDATNKKVTIAAPNAYNRVTIEVPGEEETPVKTNLDASDTTKAVTIKAGTNVTLTPNITDNSVTISAAGGGSSTNVTVSAGTGISVTPDSTTAVGVTDYKVALGYELGYLGGTVRDIDITETNQNLLSGVTITETASSVDDRFIIRNDTLYVLAVTDEVEGVDMFTITFNGTLSRTATDGYYYLNEVKIQKAGAASSIVEGTDYYSSQTGTSFISMSTTVKNSNTVYTEIDGKKYYGYSLTYVGDAPNEGETGMKMTYRITAVEETIGIANATSGTGTSDGKISYSSEEPDYWDDKVNMVYPLMDGLSQSNTIDVRISTGEGTKEGMVMALVKDETSNTLSVDWVTATGGGVEGCDGEVRLNEDDETLGYLDTKLVPGLGIKLQETTTDNGKALAIIADSDYEATITPATPFSKLESNVSLKFYQDTEIYYMTDTSNNYSIHYGIGSKISGESQPMNNIFIMPINLPSGKIENISVLSTKDAETYSGKLYITVGFYGSNVDDCATASIWGQVAMCEHDKTANIFNLTTIEDQDLPGHVYYKKFATDSWESRVSSTKGLSLKAKSLFNWVAIGFSYNSVNAIDFSIAGLAMSEVLQNNSAFAQHRGIGRLGSATNHGFYHDGRALNESLIATENVTSIALPFVQFNIVREETTTTTV